AATAVQAAENSTGFGTKAGADAAVRTLTAARRDFDAVLKHRVYQPHAEAVAVAGNAALKALGRIDWKTDPQPQPGKGTLVFTRPVGTVIRDPADETTVVMEVAREGV